MFHWNCVVLPFNNYRSIVDLTIQCVSTQYIQSSIVPVHEGLIHLLSKPVTETAMANCSLETPTCVDPKDFHVYCNVTFVIQFNAHRGFIFLLLMKDKLGVCLRKRLHAWSFVCLTALEINGQVGCKEYQQALYLFSSDGSHHLPCHLQMVCVIQNTKKSLKSSLG